MPPSNSDPRLAGRFEPGTVLGGRYRIVGLIGKGGMGEVYRADDLTLGQPVALKFLPETLVGDSDWLVRFRAEVRAARQVSHPNVCRVYDIAEVDGFTFLSMEFVQGEDLAGLLRRIGRLSPDKAAEMARGLAAGLAAAHDKGVLHRDLKPGNVLIDEHGRVRLADFGLAGVEHESDGLSGTPAYMAPELFDRKPATVQSDIYALGLVLYEMFSGKQAFSGTTVGELARLHHEITPPPLTQLVPEIDPMADRIILRCLAKDPAQRPTSALQVAAALPGGDPLAAALAAGETPSPEMVAASGGVGVLAPRLAVACLAVALIGVSAVVALSPRTQAVQYLKYEKPSAVLADTARTILQGLGYHDPVQDQAWGYATTDYLRYLETTDDSPRRYENLRPGQPPAVTFWYRQAPVEMFSDSFLLGGRLQLRVPPITSPGMVAMMLDLKGRLHYLDAVPPRIRDTEETRSKFDWNVALRFAGFDPATLTAGRSVVGASGIRRRARGLGRRLPRSARHQGARRGGCRVRPPRVVPDLRALEPANARPAERRQRRLADGHRRCLRPAARRLWRHRARAPQRAAVTRRPRGRSPRGRNAGRPRHDRRAAHGPPVVRRQRHARDGAGALRAGHARRPRRLHVLHGTGAGCAPPVA